jgi:hypothetical protein
MPTNDARRRRFRLPMPPVFLIRSKADLAVTRRRNATDRADVWRVSRGVESWYAYHRVGMIGMLIAQARRVRIWVAALVAAMYAFSILGPALAFSMDSKVSILHSLTETHGGSIILHVHHDDADHEAPGKQGPHVGHHCCGIFALATLSAADTGFSILEQPLASVRTEPRDMRALRRPSRLDRPPRDHAVI